MFEPLEPNTVRGRAADDRLGTETAGELQGRGAEREHCRAGNAGDGRVTRRRDGVAHARGHGRLAERVVGRVRAALDRSGAAATEHSAVVALEIIDVERAGVADDGGAGAGDADRVSASARDDAVGAG